MLPFDGWGQSPVKDMFEGRVTPEVEQAFRPARDALVPTAPKEDDDGGPPRKS